MSDRAITCVLDVTEDDEDDRCAIVVHANADGVMCRQGIAVPRVLYVSAPTSSIDLIRKQAGAGASCVAMPHDAGWYKVTGWPNKSAFGKTIELAPECATRLWLTQSIGGTPAVSQLPAALAVVAVAVHGSRAALLLISGSCAGAAAAATVVHIVRQDADACRRAVAKACGAAIVVGRGTMRPRPPVYIDVDAALGWLLGARWHKHDESLYRLCVEAGTADDAELSIALSGECSERALAIEVRAVARVFVARNVLSVGCELSRRTGVPLARVFEAPRHRLVDTMLLKQAVDADVVPIVVSRDPAADVDGGNGGLTLKAALGTHSSDDGPYTLLDFTSAYPSLIIEHRVCWHDPPLLPRLMCELRTARANASADEGERTALKLLANSVYGCLGSPNSRFADSQVASRVAALGRQTLRNAVAWADDFALPVLLGVTDSLLVQGGNAESLVAVVQTDQLRLSVKQRFDRVIILNRHSYVGIVGDRVVEHKGVFQRSDCAWYREHMLIGLAAGEAAIDATVAAARNALLQHCQSSRHWCARNLVRRLGGDEYVGETLASSLFAATGAADDQQPFLGDQQIAWHTDLLRKQLTARLRTTTTAAAALTLAVPQTLPPPRFGRAYAEAPVAAAMPEAPALLDIEDLASGKPLLPPCLQSRVEARYVAGQHNDQMLVYRALRAFGVSRDSTVAVMLQGTSAEKRRERERKLRGFEAVVAKAYQSSLDAYVVRRGQTEAEAHKLASCLGNCFTLAKTCVCPHAGQQQPTSVCARELGVNIDIRHPRDYVRARMSTQPAVGQQPHRKRKN